ncbi:MAG: hypothetical protein ACUVV6_09275 [Thermoplasmatota archaeon]
MDGTGAMEDGMVERGGVPGEVERIRMAVRGAAAVRARGVG